MRIIIVLDEAHEAQVAEREDWLSAIEMLSRGFDIGWVRVTGTPHRLDGAQIPQFEC